MAATQTSLLDSESVSAGTPGIEAQAPQGAADAALPENGSSGGLHLAMPQEGVGTSSSFPALGASELAASGHADWQADVTSGNLATASHLANFAVAPAMDAAPIAVSEQSIQGGAAPGTSATGAPAALVSDAIFSGHNPANDPLNGPTTSAGVGPHGATAAQVQQALGEGGLSVNGSGIKVGVLSDSFNDLGGAAADEANGALPSAAGIQILKDLSSGGADEGRAMMQIVHDIAPGASLAFYTADNSEQDFANGILALAAAGCKVICDDVGYFDEPFFQNGIVAQAIQTVEAEGVTYVTSAGNDGSAAYQAAWTPISGVFDNIALVDAESFGGSLVQTLTVTASQADPVPLLLEWDQAYGHATSDLDLMIFHNGTLIGTATNISLGEPTNPWTGYQFTASGTYQIAIMNLSGTDPGLIKEIVAGNGLPVTLSGANAGTVFGHAMTPGVITAGAVNTASTPAFGVNPVSESFSSSGAGTELLFANNGAALSSPLLLSPVTVSGVDNIATTVSGSLGDFFGTSAASASLAGVAALILAANPSLTAAEVAEIMQATATPMANSAVSGAGLAQVNAAVAAAQHFVTAIIESAGSTVLAQAGIDYVLNPVGGGTGPVLEFGGSTVIAGQLGGWAPIGAEAVGGSYEVAFKVQGVDQYTVWNTDSSGNYTGNVIGAVSGTNGALEALETTFHQDLNGDGTIGVVATSIESFGTTSLVQAGPNYFLNPVGGGAGPELKFGGVAVVAGQLGGWAPIGAEAVGGGYEVAFKVQGVDQYTVWNTDSSGNYTGNVIGAVSGSSSALAALETTFHQDLNGDGTIGIAATVIEAMGSTSLVQIAGNYFLNPVAGGTGPELKFGGTAIVAGQFNGWAPIGAEAVGGGYEVALKVQGVDQYTVWNTDSSGNYTSNVIGAVSGSSSALEALETTFHQDLNGDGTIGIPNAVIEALGATALVQIAGNYFLNPVAGGTGPELKFGGTAIVAGQFNGWAPIGVEAAGSGYEVALKVQGVDQYTVWNTDSNGNYTSNVIGAVSGSSSALEALETSFHQDLNGDGTIGIAAGAHSASVESAAVQPGQTTFDGTTLTLATPSTFLGQIIGFGSDSADQIDLRGVDYTSLHSSFDSATGVLSVAGGSTTAQLQFVGQYAQDSFQFADDGNGGTLVAASTAPAPANQSAVNIQAPPGAQHDTFVFAPNFGHVGIASFTPATDTITFNTTIFSSAAAVLAATHDDALGNAVITDAAHDTITLQHITTAQLLAHQSDFHFV
jgi:20S proteasome alpha/beta subunit